MSFITDLKFAVRSFTRTKALTLTVILTLALGIGANAAMFTVVREVLLRPLVNRDEARLIYIRQSAPGIDVENTTFSIPELMDLRSRMKTVTAIGDFSTFGPTMIGLGEPRGVRAGVVGGSYFDVMGLKAVRGRLINASDDTPKSPGVAVLTYRFWTGALGSDETVIGRVIRLGAIPATVIGVLEPSVPYPTETEIIANNVTSPHHLGATMVTGRTHRMTELFARLAPGADVESALTELRAVHGAVVNQYPADYPAKSRFAIEARLLRDQIAAPARTVLLLLLAASALIFLIACSNVANLILARSVRREGELAVRAALGASTGALRRTLLAESLLLCSVGALLGVIVALWMVPVLGRYAARFSVRALDMTVDTSVLWVGVGLAIAAAVLLAFVPRLPSAESAGGLGLPSGGVRITSATNRRLRLFAITQIGASFVLLAGAGMLLTTLIARQRSAIGFDTRQVLALNVPTMGNIRKPEQVKAFFQDIMGGIRQLPGVERVTTGSAVPWRDAGGSANFQFTVEGRAKANGEEDPKADLRGASAGFFTTLGLPVIAGRDFNEGDDNSPDNVVIISQSIAQRMFPSVEAAVDRQMTFTDPIFLQFGGPSAGAPRRIVGVVPDVDFDHIVPDPKMTVYASTLSGRMFVRTKSGDPYTLIPQIKRIIRDKAPEQPVERAATLDDVRAEVLAPDRVNALVFGGFSLVALTIAVVGVAGVLAFSVSARTREFGIRLAIGSAPGHLLTRVLGEGAVIAGAGVVAGTVGGLLLTRVAISVFGGVEMPGIFTIIGAAVVLVTAAVLASLLPAARASRVNVVTALKSE
ncbi:MAG TPA: ADOP family duplicated permease [Vicinamibacterales bacterium]|nr:ADOP family duplicated permease [Vicinamibacterales bacterium]